MSNGWHRLDEATRRSLIQTAREEADRLNRLVGNLLDMTRIEAGRSTAGREPCDIQDMIGSALELSANPAAGVQSEVTISPDVPLVNLDFVLIAQVLVNLLDNAIKYSPSAADRDQRVPGRPRRPNRSRRPRVADSTRRPGRCSISSTACSAPGTSAAPAWGFRSAKASSKPTVATFTPKTGQAAGRAIGIRLPIE